MLFILLGRGCTNVPTVGKHKTALAKFNRHLCPDCITKEFLNLNYYFHHHKYPWCHPFVSTSSRQSLEFHHVKSFRSHYSLEKSVELLNCPGYTVQTTEFDLKGETPWQFPHKKGKPFRGPHKTPHYRPFISQIKGGNPPILIKQCPFAQQHYQMYNSGLIHDLNFQL